MSIIANWTWHATPMEKLLEIQYDMEISNYGLEK